MVFSHCEYVGRIIRGEQGGQNFHYKVYVHGILTTSYESKLLDMQDEIIDRFSFKVEKPSKTFSNLLLIRSRSWSCGCLLSSRLLTRFSTCSICWVNNSIISSARFFIPSSLFSDACTIMGKLELCQHLRNITVLQAEVLQRIPLETSREQRKQKNETLESYKKPSQSRQKIIPVAGFA